MNKKKDLSREDVKVWEEYTKNPTDIYDKERNLTKNTNDEQRPNNNIETSENKEAVDSNQDSKNII